MWNFLLSLIKLKKGLIQMNKTNSPEIAEKVDSENVLKKLEEVLKYLENQNFSLKYNENRPIQP